MSLDDLCGNTQVTEETSLSGIKTSGTGRDDDILGSNGTCFSRGTSDLSVEDVGNFCKVTVGENEGDVSSELGNNLINVRTLNKICNSLFIVFISFLGLGVHLSQSSSHHSVFTADEDSILLSERSSHDGNLLGGNVIGVDKQAFFIFGDGILELSPKFVLSCLCLFSGTHF